MENFKQYRLNNRAEIEELQRNFIPEKFELYKQKLFELLQSFTPGKEYNIAEKIKSENRELFIKLSCLYMLQTGANCNVEFSNDYSTIRGVQSFNESIKEIETINKMYAKNK